MNGATLSFHLKLQQMLLASHVIYRHLTHHGRKLKFTVRQTDRQREMTDSETERGRGGKKEREGERKREREREREREESEECS